MKIFVDRIDVSARCKCKDIMVLCLCPHPRLRGVNRQGIEKGGAGVAVTNEQRI